MYVNVCREKMKSVAGLDKLWWQLAHSVQTLPLYPVPRRTVLIAIPRLHTRQPRLSWSSHHSALYLISILVDALDPLVFLHLLLFTQDCSGTIKLHLQLLPHHLDPLMAQQLIFVYLVAYNSRILLLFRLRCHWCCGYQWFPSHVTDESHRISSISPMSFVSIFTREAFWKRVGRVCWLRYEGRSFVSIFTDVALVSEGWVRAV